MIDPADYVTIERLAEYYRGGPVVGWGKNVPEEFSAASFPPTPGVVSRNLRTPQSSAIPTRCARGL
jgi:hypothetical protein